MFWHVCQKVCQKHQIWPASLAHLRPKLLMFTRKHQFGMRSQMVLRQNALQVYHGLCLATLLISPPPGPLDTMLRSLIYELWFVRCPVASRCQINIVFGWGKGGESQTAPFSLFHPISGPYLGVVSETKANRIWPTRPAEAGKPSRGPWGGRRPKIIFYNKLLLGKQHPRAAGPKSEIQPQADPAG